MDNLNTENKELRKDLIDAFKDLESVLAKVIHRMDWMTSQIQRLKKENDKL